MLFVNQRYDLSPASIDAVSEAVAEISQSHGIAKREIVKLRLSIEELLLKYRSEFGEECKIQLSSGRRLFKYFIKVECMGPYAFNPLVQAAEDEVSYAIGQLFKESPEYLYSGNINSVTYELRRPPMNPILRLGIVIFAACLLGFLGNEFLPQSFIHCATEVFITPTYEKFLSLLGAVAGPLIFCSVAWGIYGIGDISILSRMGNSMIGNYLKNLLMFAILSFVVMPVFGVKMNVLDEENASQVFQIYQLLLDIIPQNVVDPFHTGNTIQIVLLAVAFGITILYMGKQSQEIATIVGQMNTVISLLMEFICKLVPYFVFIVLVNLIWSGNLLQLLNAYKFIVALVVLLLFNIVSYTLWTSFRLHVSSVLLAKKIFPAFVIALATASSAAVYGTLLEICQHRLGIAESMVKFGVPLGVVLQKTSCAINNVLVICFVAAMADIEISLGWIVLAIIVCFVLAIATPPIPGGGVIAYTMLFTQMQLPMEYMGMILAMDVVTDFFMTATDMYCLPVVLVNQAAINGMLDEKVLHAE